ncbi:MAG: RNA polymerase sigma factor [Devosiaceae bacterium]
MTDSSSSISRTIDEVARTAYGRLIAILAKSTGDIASAEDALADAFAKALTQWADDGIPDNPQSWLLTVARNRQRDRMRSHSHRMSVAGDALDNLERREDAAIAVMNTLDPQALPDKRLELMLVCAHPAINETARTPLMLQTVLGLDAATIATAFTVPTATMAQRLVRAKAKIKQAGIAFVVPDADVINDRLDNVLEAIYGAYAAQWQDADDAGNETARDLCQEALFLADILVELLPGHAESLGLAAMLWFIHARAPARQGAEFVPLEDQDPKFWNPLGIATANALLARASAQNTLGRYQLEAAIQSVHAARRDTGLTDWRAITQLYEGLARLYPTLGGAVARAAAIGQAYGPEAGLKALDDLDAADTKAFQPAWATRAYLSAKAGDMPAARHAYQRAIALTTTIPVRRFLQQCHDRLD